MEISLYIIVKFICQVIHNLKEEYVIFKENINIFLIIVNEFIFYYIFIIHLFSINYD